MLDAANTSNLYAFSGSNALEASHRNSELMLGVASRHHPYRDEVENFIRRGFAKAHQAEIHSFMPTLLYARDTKLKAAMGVRSAQQTTFVEQYFDKSIEDTLYKHGISCQRDAIVEIGNLHSTSARVTQKLLLSSVAALAMQNKQYIVFTGIPKVTRIFDQFNIPLIPICAADESAVSNGPDKWGTYYQDAPQVMVMGINSALKAIDSCTLLTRLRKSLTCSTYIIHQHLKETLV